MKKQTKSTSKPKQTKQPQASAIPAAPKLTPEVLMHVTQAEFIAAWEALQRTVGEIEGDYTVLMYQEGGTVYLEVAEEIEGEFSDRFWHTAPLWPVYYGNSDTPITELDLPLGLTEPPADMWKAWLALTLDTLYVGLAG